MSCWGSWKDKLLASRRTSCKPTHKQVSTHVPPNPTSHTEPLSTSPAVESQENDHAVRRNNDVLRIQVSRCFFGWSSDYAQSDTSCGQIATKKKHHIAAKQIWTLVSASTGVSSDAEPLSKMCKRQHARSRGCETRARPHRSRERLICGVWSHVPWHRTELVRSPPGERRMLLHGRPTRSSLKCIEMHKAINLKKSRKKQEG